MEISIRPYEKKYLPRMLEIWNAIVQDGRAFPQTDMLEMEAGEKFFDSQSFCGLAIDNNDKVQGLYILHPNNIGRCGHICNASYGVAKSARGCGAGEKLVRHSLEKARELGFGVMQFNAVVISNAPAHKLYEKTGFTRLGIIPGGFRRDDGSYEDIVTYIYPLANRDTGGI